MTNCPNCGAVRDPAETACPYCDTPYAWAGIDLANGSDMTARVAVLTTRVAVLTTQVQACIMTPNEARAVLGLPPV